MRLRLLDQVRDLAEDADHMVARGQRHRADLNRDAAALLVYEHERAVGGLGVAEHPASECFTGPPGLLVGDDRSELAALDVADQPPAAGLIQRMIPVVSIT